MAKLAWFVGLLRLDSCLIYYLDIYSFQLLYRYHGGLDGPNRTYVLVDYFIIRIVRSNCFFDKTVDKGLAGRGLIIKPRYIYLFS